MNHLLVEMKERQITLVGLCARFLSAKKKRTKAEQEAKKSSLVNQSSKQIKKDVWVLLFTELY